MKESGADTGREGDRPSEGEPCMFHLRCNRRLGININTDQL